MDEYIPLLLAGILTFVFGWNNSAILIGNERGSGTLSGAATVVAGESHACALTGGGGVDCWGSNTEGELGDNTTVTSGAPVVVLGAGGTGTLSGATIIAAGEVHTCALLDTGGVDCWGLNASGQLGNGTLTTSYTPIAVDF